MRINPGTIVKSIGFGHYGVIERPNENEKSLIQAGYIPVRWEGSANLSWMNDTATSTVVVLEPAELAYAQACIELHQIISHLFLDWRLSDEKLKALEKALKRALEARQRLRDQLDLTQRPNPKPAKSEPQTSHNSSQGDSGLFLDQLFKVWQEQNQNRDWDGDRFPRPPACDQDRPLIDRVFPDNPWDPAWKAVIPPEEPKPITGCFGHEDDPEVKY